MTYDGAPHTATGTATGVNGESLGGLDLNSTVHTAVGTYPDTWTFTDSTCNYSNASGTVVDTINPAPAPQPYKLVKEVELVPVTKLVKVTELVPVVKLVNLRSAHLTRVFSEFPSSHQNKTVWMGCGNGRTSAGTRSGGLSIPATRDCRT